MTGGSGSVFRDLLVADQRRRRALAQLLPTKAIPPGPVDGLASAIVVVTGSTGTPHLRGELVLTDAKVTLPGMLEKPTWRPCDHLVRRRRASGQNRDADTR